MHPAEIAAKKQYGKQFSVPRVPEGVSEAVVVLCFVPGSSVGVLLSDLLFVVLFLCSLVVDAFVAFVSAVAIFSS